MFGGQSHGNRAIEGVVDAHQHEDRRLADVGVDGVAETTDRGVEGDSAVDEGDGPVAIEVEREFGVGREAQHVADGAGQASDIEGDAQRRTRPAGDRVG